MNKECVIIFGVSGRLGSVVAKKFLDEGFVVLGVGRDEKKISLLPFV
jgi:short-subunit dehydrogenase